jgi:hypothetical protein
MAARATRAGEANGVAADLAPSQDQVVVARIEPRIIEVEIEGVTPLLVCAWSEKAKQQMLEAQMGKAKKKKEHKNPEECYNAARYVSTEGWDGIPAGGMKGCLVNACRAVDGLPMTLAKRMVFIRAQGYTADGQGLVRIYGDRQMHQGMVRVSNGSADIRFRPIYRKWSAKLEVEFLANVISTEQVCNLIELAGYVEGLCEHRPGAPKNNTGDNGRFRVKRHGD